MTYIEKERKLLEKLKNQDYSPFDNKNEALDRLEKRLISFVDYANSVLKMEVLLPIYRYEFEGQEYRDRVEYLDRRRHEAHDYACACLDGLNMMCERCGMEKFADIDTENRNEVARFIGGFIAETYAIGTNLSLDAIIEYAKENEMREYSKSTIEEKLNEIMEEIDEI